eukprot:7436430-Prorocentrum_lima.AAC.1
MGDRWLNRVKKHAAEAGKKTIVEEQPGLNSVCGVGGSSNAVKTRVTVPIGVSELGNLLFKGSVLVNSDVPCWACAQLRAFMASLTPGCTFATTLRTSRSPYVPVLE